MSDTLDELTSGLQRLTNSGACNFSPARFFYIELMAAKTHKVSDNVRELVAEKALVALQSYTDDFDRAKKQAVSLADELRDQQPDLSQQLERLLSDGKFAEIKQLNFRLMAQLPSSIATLKDRLNPEKLVADHSEPPSSFKDTMDQQQKQVLENFDYAADDMDTGNKAAALKAFLSFRAFKEKYDTDKLVDQIINERPINMGPLNPHMLLVRSIESMRNLSPHYLSRFTTYIDTLLRLEDAGKKAVKRRRKIKQ
jgi:hypothetical protein